MSEVLWRRIKRYVETGHENSKVDLKETIQLEGRGREEFVKDVTAIANTPGGDGFLILGVRDAKDRQTNDPADYVPGFSTPGNSDAFQRQMIDTLSTFCNRVPPIEYIEFPHPALDRTIGVVVIRRSTQRPHSLIRGTGQLEIHDVWIRRGTASYRASPDETYDMRRRSTELPASIVVNLGGHPLTDEQRAEIREHTYIQEEITCPAHFGSPPLLPQIETLIKRIGLTLDEWQSSEPSILLVLPGLSPPASAFLAYIHGLRGGFPKVVWLHPHPDDSARYVLGEILNLQQLRDKARAVRTQGSGTRDTLP
jgi:hypothetical protein